jgi:hypothetical protein
MVTTAGAPSAESAASADRIAQATVLLMVAVSHGGVQSEDPVHRARKGSWRAPKAPSPGWQL